MTSFGADVLRVLYFFVPAYLANMAPVFAQGHFEAWAGPIDAGRTFRGRRILGDHKTWRGIVAGVVAGMATFALQRALHRTGVTASLELVDYDAVSPFLGLLLGLGTGVGDAVKSFFKRQVGIAPGASWPVFDQLDFMAGACAFAAPAVLPPLAATIATLPVILVGSVAVTSVGWWLGLKESWI